ncbi:MAG: PaaI family thioesterase [Dehalococcoidia bacterium]
MNGTTRAGCESGLDVLRAASKGSEPMPPCASLLGWQALSLAPGRVRVRFTAREEFYNPMGNVQGGFLAAMLDDTMGPALFTLLPADALAPTLELKVSFLRPAQAGPLVGEGWVVHRTRSVAFLEGALSTEDADVVATATATARIMESREA